MLAVVALLPNVLSAEILDDFEDANKSDTIWIKKCLLGTCEQAVADGVVTLAVTPAGDHGFSYLWSRERWTLLEGRTLEFRADLVSSSGDGAVGYIAFALGDELRMYTLAMDQDTIALWKRADPLQLWHFENDTSRKVNNVKLVLSMTGIRSDVRLQFRVLDNDNDGAVLFEREFWDTPDADPMAHGTDTPPQSYLGRTGLFEISVYHDNTKLFDPEVGIGRLDRAQVVFDNAEVLEYDSAWIDPPSNAVLLTWPENTAEEQIIVGADAVEGPYAPWPETIFKRQGQVCMTVERTAAQRFFMLAPGTEFIEDFDPPKQPYTSKGGWVPHFFDATDAGRWEVTNPEGTLRIRTLEPPADGRVMIPLPGTDVVTPSGLVVADFYASVDILEWTANGLATFGLSARGQMGAGFPQASNGYIGTVWLNPSKITIWNGETDISGPAFNFDPSADYRLVFSGVGPNLLLQLKNLTTGTIDAQMPYVSSRWSEGFMGLYIGEGPIVLRDITIDNYFMTGTKL